MEIRIESENAFSFIQKDSNSKKNDISSFLQKGSNSKKNHISDLRTSSEIKYKMYY